MSKTASVLYLKIQLKLQAAKLDTFKELLEQTFPKEEKTDIIGTVLAIRADSAVKSLKEAIDALDFAYSMIVSIDKDMNLH
jgi:hypothetical protein